MTRSSKGSLKKSHSMKSKLLKTVHQTAKDFHQVGIMSVTTLREFEKTCLPTVHKLAPKKIKQLRENAHVSLPFT